MNFKDAFALMGKDESFRATVYAMNTLLIQKGVYTAEEFEKLFCEHAINFKRSFSGANVGAETSRAASLSSR
jgi:hypothetical protein